MIPSVDSSRVDRIVAVRTVLAAIDNARRSCLIARDPQAFYAIIDSLVTFPALPDSRCDWIRTITVDAFPTLSLTLRVHEYALF